MKPHMQYRQINELPAFKRQAWEDSFLELHSKRINKELMSAGASRYDMWLPETHYLPFIIYPNERIMGSVYGKYSKGRGALIATDRRILFLDKKPLFVHCDEIDFDIIDGITSTRVAFAGIVTLHTHMGDFKLRTFNHKNAHNFTNYVEEKCLIEHVKTNYSNGGRSDYAT